MFRLSHLGLFGLSMALLLSFSTPLKISQTPESIPLKDTGNTYYKEGAYPEALRVYRDIFPGDSALQHDSGFRMKMGIAAYHAGECSLAAALLDTAYISDPCLRVYCLYYRALGLQEMGRDTSALEVLNRISLRRFSRIIIRDAAAAKIEILHSLKRYEPANLLLSRLIRSTRNSYQKAELYLLQVKNYYAQALREDARRTVRKLTSAFPRTSAALEAVEIYVREKRKREEVLTFKELDWAVNIFLSSRQGEKALKLIDAYPLNNLRESQSEILRSLRAKSLYYAGSFKQAVNSFRKIFTSTSIEALKDDSVIFLARCYLMMGETDKAVSYYKEHIKLFPAGSMAGEIRWKIGWLAETRKAFGEALNQYLTLERGRSRFRERGMMRAGFCYFELGEYKKAARMFGKLARYGREESMKEGGKYWNAAALMNAGDSAAARKSFKKLIAAHPLHYYAFRARERLGGQDSTFIPARLSVDSLFQASEELPADSMLLNAVRIGEIVGHRYGKAVMDELRRNPLARHFSENTFWNAYHRIGVFSGALRLAIQIRQRKRTRDAQILDTDLFWRVYPPFYNALVRRYAGEVDMPPALVFALMRRESAFEVDVRSSAGALGLMQIMPATGRKLGREMGIGTITADHLVQAQWNVRLGVRYLRDQINSFQGIIPAAVAAYNAGPEAVKRWIKAFGTDDIETFIESIEYTETRNYVKRVLGDFWIYRNLYGF